MRNSRVAQILVAVIVLVTAGLSDIPFETTMTPTFYSLASLADWIPDGGAQIAIIQPKVPSGASVVAGWTGTARAGIIHEDGVDEVFFEDVFTGAPVEAISVSAEMGIGLIRANGEGSFSLRAEDAVGSVKASTPMAFDIVPSGETAVRWGIIGPKSMNFPSQISVHWVIVMDDEGRPVPSVFPGLAMSAVSVRIISESNPDSSASVASAFDRVPDYEVMPMGFYSIFPFILSNTEAETVLIIAEGMDDFLANSDTFEVVFLPDDSPATLIVMSADGIRIPVDTDAGLVAVSFHNNITDPNNYSTRVRLEAVDLAGPGSATIAPPGWQTVVGGAAGFTLHDTETDTNWIFIAADIDSTPLLDTPVKSPIQVVPADWAIALNVQCPGVAMTDDTAKIVISAVDSRNDIDADHSGFFNLDIYGDAWGTAVIIDSITGGAMTTWEIDGVPIPLESGRRALYVTSPDAGDLYFRARDAENVGLFDNGLLRESPERGLRFEIGSSGGAVRYSFIDPGDYYFPADEELTLTIVARNSTDAIDIDYSGSVSVGASGSVTTNPPDGIVAMSAGIATIGITGSATEDVQIIADGPLYSDTLRVRFIRRGEGGVLAYSNDYEWIPIGADRNMRVVVFNDRFIETRYHGVATVSVIDPDGDESAVFPDSFAIISGLGFFPLRNSSAERLTVIVDGGGHVGAMSFVMESRARVNVALPGELECTIENNISFELSDFFGAHYPSSGTLFVNIVEEIPNGSLSYDSLVVIEDGRATLRVTNSEPESAWVYVQIPEGQLFYMDAEETEGWRYFTGSICFVPCDIDETELPREFAVRAYPNPFNSAVRIEIESGGLTVENIDIYDISGRRVADLDVLDAGKEQSHAIIWRPDELSSGIYFIKVRTAKGQEITRRLVFIK